MLKMRTSRKLTNNKWRLTAGAEVRHGASREEIKFVTGFFYTIIFVRRFTDTTFSRSSLQRFKTGIGPHKDTVAVQVHKHSLLVPVNLLSSG